VMSGSDLAKILRELQMIQDPLPGGAMIDVEHRPFKPAQVEVFAGFDVQNSRVLLGKSSQKRQASDVVQQAGRVASVAIDMQEARDPLAQDGSGQVGAASNLAVHRWGLRRKGTSAKPAWWRAS